MVIVWGKRFAGKVDVVPGVFHVATLFQHAYYVPFLPDSTYLMVQQDGPIMHPPIPVKIEWSLKSIGLAWLRFGSLAVASLCAIIALALSESRAALIPTVIMVVSGSVGWWLCCSKFCTRASFARACKLLKASRLGDEWYQAVEEQFGQAVPRGFEITQAATRVLDAEPVSDALPESD